MNSEVYGEDWHCARCWRRSGIYGHNGQDGWYCHEANALTPQEVARCQAFDADARARKAAASALPAAQEPPDLRVRAEAMYEEIGGDLCVCQRVDVPHWCEKCQQRINLIESAFIRVLTAMQIKQIALDHGIDLANLPPLPPAPAPQPEPPARAAEKLKPSGGASSPPSDGDVAGYTKKEIAELRQDLLEWLRARDVPPEVRRLVVPWEAAGGPARSPEQALPARARNLLVQARDSLSAQRDSQLRTAIEQYLCASPAAPEGRVGGARSSVTDPETRAMDNIPEFEGPPLPGHWSSEGEPAPASSDVRGIDAFVDELLNMQYSPAGIKTVLLAFAAHVRRLNATADGCEPLTPEQAGGATIPPSVPRDATDEEIRRAALETASRWRLFARIWPELYAFGLAVRDVTRLAGGAAPALTDDRILALWRSVQGPHAGLTGPLIRFAHLIAKGGAAPAPSVPAWQPIETAPKDADAVLLWADGWGVLPGYWDADTARWIATETQGLTCGGMSDGPTHWMPLPAAPSGQEK